jgi:flavin-dependent dehydrogenase
VAAPFTRTQLSTAAGFFIPGVRASAITIKSMRGQPGYLWSFPRPDHLAVGVCAPATHKVSATRLRAESHAWIEEHRLLSRDCTGEAGHHLIPYAWPIPSVGFDDAARMTCGGPGWMLLGDAAGLVDPLTREGIFYALLSGVWAAEALEAASDRAATLYTERLRTDVHPELARAARLSGLFFSQPFSSLFVDALRESDGIRKVFVDLVGGVQPYRGLRRRLLGTGEWRLAAKAIQGTMRRSFSLPAT